jgi:hypothetical protein
MDTKTLIPLPVFDAVAQTAVEFLLQGKNVAIVGPPGAGTTSVGFRVQRQLSANKLPFAMLDCATGGDIAPRLAEFIGPKREPGQTAVILIDHAVSLQPTELLLVATRVRELAAQNPTALLWLGALDARSIRVVCGLELHTDTRTHLCLPELNRDDLLRLYRVIAFFSQATADKEDRADLVRLYQKISASGEIYWGRWSEAMNYFVLDWCGNDLGLAADLAQHFSGDWRQNIHDESVADCLTNWLAKSSAIQAYRKSHAALPNDCKEQLRLLYGGGKLVAHRPEIHLETCEKMRRLFLDGFLCANLLPGYYQFRHLAARFVVEEGLGLKAEPIELLRRAANARVNLLLQDVEVSLRGMLKSVFRQMSTDEVKSLLKGIPTQQRLIDEDFREKLMDWAGQQNQPSQPDLRAGLGKFLGQETAKFRAANNLWSEVRQVFHEASGLDADPTSEQAVDCLTFNQLKDLLQTLSAKVFLDKPRTKRLGDPPSKRWPGYLTRVRRLRNDAAHLRNISFQDIEDLLKDLNEIRKDQSAFGIIP